VLEVHEVEKLFFEHGGLFLTSAESLSVKLQTVRAVAFDWDGVFNAGSKGAGSASTFAEADSMGTNLLRYALWRQQGALPVSVVITGADNPSAVQFAQRERFSAVYSGIRNKAELGPALAKDFGVQASEMIYVFDDVNDLGLAAECALRCLVRRAASPLLQEFAARRGLCDYITAASGGAYAVREVCELMLGLLGCFEAVVESRLTWDVEYAAYFAARQAVETALSLKNSH